jgi:hypothetical protein
MISVRRGSEHGVTFLTEPRNAFSHLLRLELSLRYVSVESLVGFRAALEFWAAHEVPGHVKGAVVEALGQSLVGGVHQTAETN